MTVEWTRPEDDGGGDITAYVIKYGAIAGVDSDTDSDVSDERTDVHHYATVTVAGNTTSFKFTDQLDEETYYRFAVAAENTAGQGKFSEFSDYVRTGYGE